MTRKPAPEHFANCGASIPRHARACPECGADERTGWDESDASDGLDLPDDDTSAAHNAFLREQHGDKPRTSGQWFWWIVGLLLILALVLGTLGLS